jgi:hypothetical protein
MGKKQDVISMNHLDASSMTVLFDKTLWNIFLPVPDEYDGSITQSR